MPTEHAPKRAQKNKPEETPSEDVEMEEAEDTPKDSAAGPNRRKAKKKVIESSSEESTSEESSSSEESESSDA